VEENNALTFKISSTEAVDPAVFSSRRQASTPGLAKLKSVHHRVTLGMLYPCT
jgi:hypothetical protein